MTWIDHSRRAATVLLVALCVVAVPVVASATFSGRTAPSLLASTRTMVTPTGITGTYACDSRGQADDVTVNVTGFTDTGPSGATYGYSLALGANVVKSGSSTSKSYTLSASQTTDGQSTTWTVGAQARLNQWTSGIATRTVVCPKNGTASGNL